MTPMLIALAGPSRSGKGTCATVFASEAQALGLTIRERQLSGPGKQYVADAFRPGITEEEAIEWLESLKSLQNPRFDLVYDAPDDKNEEFTVIGLRAAGPVMLQEYLQRMLQGARERWGTDFWTDKLLPVARDYPDWHHSFAVKGDGEMFLAADICLISDLRQVNEAERVKALGGIVIEMRRPPVENNSYITGSSHITEQALGDLRPDLVDYVIDNHHTVHNEESMAWLHEACKDAWDAVVEPLLVKEAKA